MSRGISEAQKAILQKIEENGSLNIIEACALVNYLRAKKKDPSISPNYVWLWPSEPGELTEYQRNVQSIYRMMRSLENRGLVARLLHRRPAVWWGVSWKKEGKPQLILNPKHSWFHFNVVAQRDGRVKYRTKGKTWVIHYPEPTYSQLRHQDIQKRNDLNRWINRQIRRKRNDM
jgi:hypothetical protein